MILEKLQGCFASEILSTHQDKGDLTVVIRKDCSHDILRFLKEDPDLSFEMLMDLCGVDNMHLEREGGNASRFEVVYHLYSVTKNHRLRVRVQVSEEAPSIASVNDLWRSADWAERETAEMFGLRFEGHPNPKPLLLFEGFEGHPLRKDYPIAKRHKIPVPEEKLS